MMTTLPESSWPAMPVALAERLHATLRHLTADPDVTGILAAGSFLDRTMDEWSDLDLVVVVSKSSWPAILERRKALAAGCGPLLAAFTGEHVGEPRLLICLYGPPVTHVDLKFVTAAMLEQRVEEPVILWARDGSVAEGLARGVGSYPQPNGQWIEDRFWVWVHYAATKIGRGEYLEAHGGLGFLRGSVLGPLILARKGARPNGVRRIEALVPDQARALAATVGPLDRGALLSALRAAVALYREVRDPEARRNDGAEAEVMKYLEKMR